MASSALPYSQKSRALGLNSSKSSSWFEVSGMLLIEATDNPRPVHNCATRLNIPNSTCAWRIDTGFNCDRAARVK